ncbi:MAG: hypothetical protein KatS3mg113_0324 [Planctomycetaceae bacterium]|nr:MAG: hypothetical protein KatS3mg113_0324 [Planctomycetaceae bacterium]
MSSYTTEISLEREAETETSLIERAQRAISHCAWEVGACAALWTQRYARGRTDADFGLLIGLSADQVYQRRRVWETFSDVYQQYPHLKWSHFYAALNWDDAAECLQWAEEQQATVAEMRAWRRMQRGEDLSQPAEDEAEQLPLEPVPVKSPVDVAQRDARQGNTAGREHAPVMSGVARASEESYAPFHAGAISPPEESSIEKAPLSFLQRLKRVCSLLERAANLIDEGFAQEYRQLPPQQKQRLQQSWQQLKNRVEDWI